MNNEIKSLLEGAVVGAIAAIIFLTLGKRLFFWIVPKILEWRERG